MSLSKCQVAELIDHTLLKPDVSKTDIITLCQEAMLHGFASVCINPYYVPLAVKTLAESSIKVCTVVGFPLGVDEVQVKAFEAENAVLKGAHEVDMVLNVGALKSGDYSVTMEDILRVVDKAKAVKAETIVKVIIEACLLNEEEKVKACLLAKKAGADFVKTSTGFNGGGATLEDVKLMRKTVGPDMGVKASGGIRSMADALAMHEAGANRIGTSSGVAIMGEFGEECSA